MESYLNLYNRAVRAIAGRPMAQVIERTRAIVGPPVEDLEGAAHEALAALKAGRRPTAEQVAALQAVIRSMRPSLLSQEGAVEALPDAVQPVFPAWKAFVERLLPYLYTIGRIDRKARGVAAPEPLGTGFLIAPDLLLTNHHVVTQLTGGTDILNLGDAEVRFVQEYNAPDRPAVRVAEVHSFHEEEDAAILKLETRMTAGTQGLLAWSQDAPSGEGSVAVVGYPFPDTTRNPLFVDQVFGGRFGVKRLAPGETIGERGNALYHDCSTLGGNSGSPVLDLRTCTVVGLHRDGYFLARNEAVSVTGLRDYVAAA